VKMEEFKPVGKMFGDDQPMTPDKREELRERIRRVFIGRAIPVNDPKQFGICERLIDDILDCLPPEPDLERLAKIIRVMGESPNAHFTVNGKYDSLENHFLAWTAGEREEVWCEHIQKDYEGDYRLKATGALAYRVQDDWTLCPIRGCGKERP